MGARLVIADPAATDLGYIFDFLAGENPLAAEKTFVAITAAMERLSVFPNIGRAGRVPGTRELLVTPFPYLIVYEVMDRSVVVVAIFHTSRDLAREIQGRKS